MQPKAHVLLQAPAAVWELMLAAVHVQQQAGQGGTWQAQVRAALPFCARGLPGATHCLKAARLAS